MWDDLQHWTRLTVQVYYYARQEMDGQVNNRTGSEFMYRLFGRMLEVDSQIYPYSLGWDSEGMVSRRVMVTPSVPAKVWLEEARKLMAPGMHLTLNFTYSRWDNSKLTEPREFEPWDASFLAEVNT